MQERRAGKKLSVIVGRPWPKGIEVGVERPQKKQDSRLQATIWLGLMFGLAFIAFMVFGMYHHDGQTLDKVWNMTYVGIGGIMGWALGRTPKGGT